MGIKKLIHRILILLRIKKTIFDIKKYQDANLEYLKNITILTDAMNKKFSDDTYLKH